MQRYARNLIEKVRKLRTMGKTYSEIRSEIQRNDIPKSTLSEWCKAVVLPQEYTRRIQEINKSNAHKGRLIALIANKIKREKIFIDIRKFNLPISSKIHEIDSAKIALAMLCLGKASKSANGASSFYLGSSDPKIITIFLKLLQLCFPFNLKKIRATVQCRADQNIFELEEFWMEITQIPKELFYKAQVDPRTKDKPTKKKDYKGVLRIDYLDSRVWFELESLADLIYNQLIQSGPVA